MQSGSCDWHKSAQSAGVPRLNKPSDKLRTFKSSHLVPVCINVYFCKVETTGTGDCVGANVSPNEVGACVGGGNV
jgi:hypothetical protein